MKLLLASNSPRRRELLGGLGWPFEVIIVEGIDESYPEDLSPEDTVRYIARKKAAVYTVADDELVITADTIVVLGNKIMGKPVDASDASRMLRELSGKTHHVMTAVCIKTACKQHELCVATDVTFKELSDDEIDYYVSRYHPFDKAGAYGIQEWIGFIGVTAIRGSYFNVVGFPVQRIYDELRREFGISLPSSFNTLEETP